ncbi:MAG TPA: hypothetical protein VMU46_02430 [Burkholderiales bacterium]|nr:hypothetical protein [Burkholderiales bacterium]
MPRSGIGLKVMGVRVRVPPAVIMRVHSSIGVTVLVGMHLALDPHLV